MAVLDLGGGSGLWLEAFRNAGTAAGILIDPRSDYVNFAAKRWEKFHSETYFPVIGCAEALPLKSIKVNLVVSRNSLHLWRNIALGIQNIFRVLMPGGFAFVGRGFGPDLPEETRETVKEKRSEYYRQFFDGQSEHEEPRSPPPEEIIVSFMDSGFKSANLIPDHKAWWVLAQK